MEKTYLKILIGSTLLFLAFLNPINGQAATAPTSGLVGYWNFDAGSGSTLTDNSGNNNTGTLVGSPVWTSGKLNGGLQLTGSNYVSVPSSSSLSVNGAGISYGGWMYHTSTANGYFLGKTSSNYTYIVGVDQGSQQFVAFLNTTNGLQILRYPNSAPGALTPYNNSWVHIFVTYDGVTMKMYINGTQVVSQAATGNVVSTNDSLGIGNRGDTAWGNYNSKIDEIRMYNRALSAQEVSDVSNDGGGTVIPPSDTIPPVISSISTSGITSNSASIAWSTNEIADSQIEYGVTTSYGNATALDTNLNTSHTATLSSLSANTLYHYRVKSKDAAGNISMSADQTFTTNNTQTGSQPTISFFTASPSNITSGQTTTLSWSVSGSPAPTLSISGIGAVSGTSVAVNPSITTTYVLTATNASGSVTASTPVTVSSGGTGLVVNTSANSSNISRYDVYELTMLNSGSYNNPWEDVSINATFTAPSGQTKTIGGFYYDTNTWKLRFAPQEVGTYNWSLTFTAPTGTYSTSGSFVSNASAKPGFVRINQANKYRLYTEGDGKAFYPIGMDVSLSDYFNVALNIDDSSPNFVTDGILDYCLGGEPINCHANGDVYFGTHATQGKANFVRQNGEDTDGTYSAGIDLVQFNAGGKNTYSVKKGKFRDSFLKDASKYNFHVMWVPYYRPEDFVPGFDLSNPTLKAAWFKYWQYNINRYGAYVDVWEQANERDPTSAYFTAVGNYIRANDPYQHPITTSNQPTTQQTLVEISSPHTYLNVPNTDMDYQIANGTYGINTTKSQLPNQPIIAGEVGNSGTVTNYSPTRYRIFIWTYFFNEAAPIFWDSSWTKSYPTGGLTNMYIGVEERALSTVFYNVLGDFDPLARPLSTILSTTNARAYVLGSSSDIAGYVVHTNTQASALTGTTLTLNIPQAGMTGQWINPQTGAIISSFNPGSGSQTLSVPSFTVDIAFRIKSSGGTPPPTLPTISSFLASPSSITSGQSSTLSWITSNSTSLSLNQSIGAVTGTSRSVSPTTTTTYTLTATNSSGSVTANTTVTVTSAADVTPPTTPTNLTASAISSSGISLAWSASTDVVGVTGYRIYRAGVQVGTSATNSFTDAGLSASTAYSYTVDAIDAAGNASTKSTASTATTLAAATPPPTGSNSITITEKSGITQASYPVQIGRPFVQGEIPSGQLPQAFVSGTAVPTQVDVKQRWSDGSLKHAIISFLIPTLSANQTVTVTFSPGATVGNTPLTASEMLASGFNFDAITQVGSQSASARTMLANGAYTYWTSGPIATTIILADNTNKTYDIGTNGAFRPEYDVTFWANINKVRVRFIGENADTEKITDQTYNLVLKTGNSPQTQVYSKTGVTHYARSRWTKEYWIGSYGSSTINHNLSYLKATKFLPNYDTTLTMSPSNIAAFCTRWTGASKDLYDAGNWTKYQGTAGGRDDIGPYPAWVVAWLYSGDSCLRDMTIGNADLSAAWPIHYREGKNTKTLGMGVGKPVSIANRPTIWFSNLSIGSAGDIINPIGTVTTGGWDPDPAHEPDPASVLYAVTGDYWYLEEMQFWTSYNAGSTPANQWNRGPSGTEGVLGQDQIRQSAWQLRTLTNTAFVSPDNTTEKTYFEKLIGDAISAEEGIRNITGTPNQGNAVWNYGRTVLAPSWSMSSSFGLPPLHEWRRGDTTFAQTDYGVCSNHPDASACSPVTVSEAISAFEVHYLEYALGRAKELGYATGPLLSWIGQVDINILTNPAVNHYIIANGRWPTVKADGTYIQDWATFQNSFVTAYKNATNFTPIAGAYNGPTDYPALAMGAVSFLTGEPNGQAAWNWINTNVYLGGNGPNSSNPQWAILPRSGSTTPPPSDTTSPSVPTGVSATAISQSSITVSWSAATDNVGVTGYKVFRGGVQISTATGTSYTDIGLNAATTYSYTISAYDAAGNASAQSLGASATTQTAVPTPDVTAPTVSITSPTTGTVSGTIAFSASGLDSTVSGAVTSGLKLLSLLVDGNVFATSTSGVVSKSLDTTTLSNANHTLTAVAVDNAGNSATSNSVSITVNNTVVTKFNRKVKLTSLEGISNIPQNTMITATVASPTSGSVLETQSNLAPDTSGNYTISFLSTDPQLVDIRIKVNGYLSQLIPSIDTTQNSSASISIGTLLAGDVNNDNTINSVDYSLINTYWNQSFAATDINQDGITNSLDFSILRNNFGKVGQ